MLLLWLVESWGCCRTACRDCIGSCAVLSVVASGIAVDRCGEVVLPLAVVLGVGVQQVAAGGGVSPMCGRCWHVIVGEGVLVAGKLVVAAAVRSCAKAALAWLAGGWDAACCGSCPPPPPPLLVVSHCRRQGFPRCSCFWLSRWERAGSCHFASDSRSSAARVRRRRSPTSM